MKYKRLLTLALAAALCIVAAACGTKNNAPGADTPTKTDTPTAAPGGTQTVGDTGDGTVREDGSYVPGQVNRLRLTYNGNVSSCTSPRRPSCRTTRSCPPTTMRSSRTMRWCWCRSR